MLGRSPAIERHDLLERDPLVLDVFALPREPGAQPGELFGGKVIRFEVPHRLEGPVEPAGGHGPVKPGSPDVGVIRPAEAGGIEPSLGFLDPAGLGRQIGSCKPDAFVVESR